MKLGKLTLVELRSEWPHEAYDFTSWLSQENNLALLSDEIGIEIKFLKDEASVGDFSVDILAEEENTGRKIIIENQLEKTNHDHLGKIITYASGYDAEFIIWIVEDVRDEHKQAIDWLNEHTDDKINLFAVKMELWKINESPAAPKFNVVCKPNEWSKTIKKVSCESKLTSVKLLQLKYWTNFKDYCQSKKSSLKPQSPRPQHWNIVTIGVSSAHIGLTLNSFENRLSCEIYIPDNKPLYYELEKVRVEIERELVETLDWRELESKKASRIMLSREFDLNNTEDWENSFIWLEEKALKFKKVFGHYIPNCLKEVSLPIDP